MTKFLAVKFAKNNQLMLQIFFVMVSLRRCDNLHCVQKNVGTNQFVRPINVNKRGDDMSTLVELLPFAPRMFARDLLHLNNAVLITEHLEQSDDYANKIENWEGEKKIKTFRPNATVCILCNFFTYARPRIEPALDFGFRAS